MFGQTFPVCTVPVKISQWKVKFLQLKTVTFFRTLGIEVYNAHLAPRILRNESLKNSTGHWEKKSRMLFFILLVWDPSRVKTCSIVNEVWDCGRMGRFILVSRVTHGKLKWKTIFPLQWPKHLRKKVSVKVTS